MNKLFLSALLCGATLLSASAKEYVVYQEAPLTADQELLPTNFYLWNGTATVANENGISTWTIDHLTDWWGGGWDVIGETFDIAQFNNTNCKLVFDYKTTSKGTFKVQLNGKEPELDIIRDGEWHTATLDIRSTFPGALESLQTGKNVYAFAPVGGGDWAVNDAISFRNIKIVEGEPYVEPTYEYGAKWYGYMEKDLTVGTETYPITVSYTLTALQDGHLQVDAEMTGVEELPSLNEALQLHIGASWPHATKNADGTYTWISKDNEGNDATFALKEGVNPFQFWFAYQGGGLFADEIAGYMFGAANEKPVIAIAPKLKATAEEITATSANLVYNVTLPEELAGAAVTVYLNGEKAAASPVALTGLTPSTDYSYELYAVAAKDGEEYKSKTATVKFKTNRDANAAVVWNAIVDGYVTNAYLIGEEESARRNIPVSFETAVSWNPDGTITVDAKPHGTQQIVGLVPKISVSAPDFVHDDQDMTVKEDGSWTYTTPDACAEGLAFPWLKFRPAYAGGICDIVISGYKAGAEQAPVAYGAPAQITLDFPKTELVQNEAVALKALTTDANGHFLLDEQVESSFAKGNVFEIENGMIVAKHLGSDELYVTSGELSSRAIFVCLTEGATDLHSTAKISSTTDPEMDFAAAFDGNEGTQIDFGTESAEHNLTLELDKTYYIQAVQLVWEGASAMDYTVTLTPGDVIIPSEAAAQADEPYVFTVTDGIGGAGMTVRKNFYTENMASIKANKVELNTTAAATPWGIKLKEMKVLGAEKPVEDLPTGVNAAEVENDGLVNVYDLQGVLVLKNVSAAEIINLPRGIYVAGGRKYIVK